jgi:hypothetical protein
VRLDVAGVADRQQRRFGLFQFRAFLMDSEKGKEKKKKMSKGGHFLSHRIKSMLAPMALFNRSI